MDDETRQWRLQQEESWYVWQEPWFRHRYPIFYIIFRFMNRIGL